MRIHLIAFATLISILLSGCDPGKSNRAADREPGQLNLVATTGQIHDALVNLTRGTDATIHLFCGPGVDPHSFSASGDDVQKMLDADLIVYNGFHLEAKLDQPLHQQFADKSWSMASAFPATNQLDWIEEGMDEPDPAAPIDPHIWNDLQGWTGCVEALAEKLGEQDPNNAEKYRQNCVGYCDNIKAVHEATQTKLATLPKANRWIVSSHDAFNYFAKQYDMQTLAVLGIGNDPEADIKTMQRVATTISEKKIPAIFMESITNSKISQALREACEAKGWQVKLIETPLYSDDLGDSAPQNTFLGAFESNVDIIYEALK